jgi:hypothetical protein
MSSTIRLLLASSLLASTAAADSAPVVTLDDHLLGREVERLAGLGDIGRGVTLRGEIGVRRRSASSLWVDVPLRRPHGAEFTIRIGTEVVCSRRTISAYVADVEFDADNARAWFFETIPTLVDRIEQGVEEGLSSNVFPGLRLDVACPGVEVTSDGSLRLDFGPGSECNSGQRVTRACGGGTTGPGIVLSCQNGRWEVASALCEPRSSNGQQQL